jgi:hypothetical protein
LRRKAALDFRLLPERAAFAFFDPAFEAEAFFE